MIHPLAVQNLVNLSEIFVSSSRQVCWSVCKTECEYRMKGWKKQYIRCGICHTTFLNLRQCHSTFYYLYCAKNVFKASKCCAHCSASACKVQHYKFNAIDSAINMHMHLTTAHCSVYLRESFITLPNLNIFDQSHGATPLFIPSSAPGMEHQLHV